MEPANCRVLYFLIPYFLLYQYLLVLYGILSKYLQLVHSSGNARKIDLIIPSLQKVYPGFLAGCIIQHSIAAIGSRSNEYFPIS